MYRIKSFPATCTIYNAQDKKNRKRGLLKKCLVKTLQLSNYNSSNLRILRPVNQIKDVYCDFEEKILNKIAFDYLVKFLQKSKHMTSFSINCSKDFIKFGKENNFWRQFGKLVNLQGVSIKLEENAEKEGLFFLKPLFKGFSKTKNLRRLSFSSQGHSKIFQKDIELLFLYLNSLSKLESLELNFRWCNSITDSELKDLGRHISKKQELKSLILNLGWLKKISDDGFKKFIQFLSKLVHLECLKLNLSGWELISEQAISSLILCLKKYKFLKCLFLDLSNCVRIGRKSLWNIFDVLSEQKYFSAIHLNIAHNISPSVDK